MNLGGKKYLAFHHESKRVNGFILYPEATDLRKMRERMIDNLVIVPASLETKP